MNMEDLLAKIDMMEKSSRQKPPVAPPKKKSKVKDIHSINNLSTIQSALNIGDMEKVAMFYKSKHIDTVDNTRSSGLFYACRQKNIELLQFFLENKANINQLNNSNEPALFTAIRTGYYEIVELLMKHGANVNGVNINGVHKLPLVVAIEAGKADIVMLLLTACDVNCKDSVGATALFHACIGGDMEIIQLLVDAEADMNITCVSKNEKEIVNPLSIAAFYGHVEVVKMFLETNENLELSIPGSNNDTSLMYAIRGKQLEAATLLAEAEYKAENASYEGKKSGQMYACELGMLEFVKMLYPLSHPLQKANTEYNAIHYAALRGYTDIVSYLLSQGEAVDTVYLQVPLLQSAILSCNVSCVDLILKHKADVNIRGENEQTSLSLAVAVNDEQIAQLLLHAGAEVDALTNSVPPVPVLFDVLQEETYTNSTKIRRQLYLQESVIGMTYEQTECSIKMILEGSSDEDNMMERMLAEAEEKRQLELKDTFKTADKEQLEHVDHSARAELSETDEKVQLAQKMFDTRVNFRLLQVQLDSKADVNYTLPQGVGYLFNLVSSVNVDTEYHYGKVCQVLLDHKANVNACSAAGDNIMALCIKNNLSNIATLLLNNGFQVNQYEDKIYTSHLERVSIAGTAPIDVQKDGEVFKVHQDTCAILTPLQYSIMTGSPILQSLIIHKASLNYTHPQATDFGTALHIACKKGDSKAIKMLVQAGADVNTVDNDENTPLLSLLQSDRAVPEDVQVLIKANANVNAVNTASLTPCLQATMNRQDTMAKYLLEAKAEPNVIDSQGLSILAYAINFKSGNVPLLLEAKANPNDTIVGSMSMLMLAIHHKNIPVIKELLAAKADPTFSAEGQTALVFAQNTNNTTIVNLIKKAL